MSPEQFWRSTPRLTNLYVAGYLRRREWAAFHAGYGVHIKDALISDLRGKPRPAPKPEDMLARFDLIAARHNAAVANDS